MRLIESIKCKWQILILVLLIAVCIFLTGCGAEKPKVYRVGIISGAPPFESIGYGFKMKMTELGYIEGENIIYDFKKMSIDPQGFQRVARKFVEDEVDLIFAFPTEPAVEAKAATKGTDIPVVFAMAGLEGYDLIENVRQPGKNITGVRFPIPELSAKQVELLHELVPKAKRVYIIYDRNYPNTVPALKEMHSIASSLNITLVKDPVNNVQELQAALQKRAALDDISVDAILFMPDILNHSPDGFGAILEFASEHRVPLGGGMDFTVDLGAMFSYVPDNVDQGRLAAILVDKVFRGIPAGTIPVVTPECRLRLNYRVIQELGLEVSEGLLSRADEIIK
jgi:putative ABC transport system substrate-binding protein